MVVHGLQKVQWRPIFDAPVLIVATWTAASRKAHMASTEPVAIIAATLQDSLGDSTYSMHSASPMVVLPDLIASKSKVKAVRGLHVQPEIAERRSVLSGRCAKTLQQGGLLRQLSVYVPRYQHSTLNNSLMAGGIVIEIL